MRIVFMGTAEFAVPSLKILLHNNYDIASVVTAPDRPAGRGLQISQSPIKQVAQQYHLSILQPEHLMNMTFTDCLRSLTADLFVVVAFRILPSEVLLIPKIGGINLHASLLPKYRGAAPINWAIIRGERETGVTTFFLREHVDTGNIILQARVPIGPEETAGELHNKLAEVGAEIVLHTVRLIETGKVSQTPQDESFASKAPKIFKKDCRINWAKSAQEVHNFIRGLSPKPGAYTFFDGISLKIYRSKVVSDDIANTPGKILACDDRLIIATGRGKVEILELQQEGKKRLSTSEFLNGRQLRLGNNLS